MIIVGIDYSLTSPAICIHEGEEWSYDNCTFHFISKKDPSLEAYTRYDYPKWNSDQDRYHKLASWAFSTIIHDTFQNAKSPVDIHMEGYAYGATGRVFEIAENTSTIKNILWMNGYPLSIWAPTVIKKFATGKGNAKKEQMENAFITETHINLREALNQTASQNNPSSDIIDAYYVAKHGFHMSSLQMEK